ncbi:MAG: RluA family pseudouridine synthase [Bacteroidaceae bacterium]|nr:RluA family pseudouridine synthase [Bacteroidaceae bacterium]
MRAADEVRLAVESNDAWHADALKGKMFGVLVVLDGEGRCGYLAAFSGLLDGRNKHDFFVPPVFDFLSPTGYFKCEEREISEINNTVVAVKAGDEYKVACETLARMDAEREHTLATEREAMRMAKEGREQRRASGGLSPEEEQALLNESRFAKAEYKRNIKRWDERMAPLKDAVAQFERKISALKEERKRRSAALQKWLFDNFTLLDSLGESRSLTQIFATTRQGVPPAGAGECSAPKLLQYAFANGYTPVAMAEFWMGASPVGEVRRDGCFYGSCTSKCRPILSFMLQGMDVEDEFALQGGDVEILYEDDYLLAVNKPAGMLSAPGINGGVSLEEYLQRIFDNDNIRVVHRLDMSTSGVLLAAKSPKILAALQEEFADRRVSKRYVALIEGVPAATEGEIALPLAADYDNRPRQRVDFSGGKQALTRYKVLQTVEYSGRRCTRVAFYPVTGRTHQLRVHAAYSGGLNAPIVGDELYGTPDRRLMLHAEWLSFVHPVTGERVEIECAPDF